MDSYCLYGSADDGNKPNARYGSAALALIDRDLFPVWALFAYKDLAASAGGAIPDPLAFVHDDAIILGPVIDGSIIKGMLICKENASNKRLFMEDENGIRWLVDMPNIKAKVFATENAELTYTRL